MGIRSRRKGADEERAVVHALQERGFAATKESRMYQSGTDVSVPYNDRELRLEVKLRADGFRTLYDWLEKDGADALTIRANGKKRLWVFPEELALEILAKVEGVG